MWGSIANKEGMCNIDDSIDFQIALLRLESLVPMIIMDINDNHCLIDDYLYRCRASTSTSTSTKEN